MKTLNPNSEHKIKNEADNYTKWTVVWRIVNFVMFIFFTLCAVVQLNDPDHILWVTLYLIPAVLCLSVVIVPTVSENPVWKTCAVCTIGASLVMGVYTAVLLAEYISYNNPLEYEEGRELGGLIIITVWMCVCRFTSFGNSNPGKGSGKALLLLTCMLAFLPLFMWSLCFIENLAYLGHCKEMFTGMLSSYKYNGI